MEHLFLGKVVVGDFEGVDELEGIGDLACFEDVFFFGVLFRVEDVVTD